MVGKSLLENKAPFRRLAPLLLRDELVLDHALAYAVEAMRGIQKISDVLTSSPEQGLLLSS